MELGITTIEQNKNRAQTKQCAYHIWYNVSTQYIFAITFIEVNHSSSFKFSIVLLWAISKGFCASSIQLMSECSQHIILSYKYSTSCFINSIEYVTTGIQQMNGSEKYIGWLYDVIKWKHFPRYWPFMGGIQRWPVNSSHKGQWRGALMFSLIYAWTKGWVNNRDAGGLRGNCAYHDVTINI